MGFRKLELKLENALREALAPRIPVPPHYRQRASRKLHAEWECRNKDNMSEVLEARRLLFVSLENVVLAPDSHVNKK